MIATDAATPSAAAISDVTAPAPTAAGAAAATLLVLPVLHVADVAASAQFYVSRLGFTAAGAPGARQSHVLLLWQGAPALRLLHSGTPGAVAVRFLCPDANATARGLQAAAAGVEGVFVATASADHDGSSGAVVAAVADPDGHDVGFESGCGDSFSGSSSSSSSSNDSGQHQRHTVPTERDLERAVAAAEARLAEAKARLHAHRAANATTTVSVTSTDTAAAAPPCDGSGELPSWPPTTQPPVPSQVRERAAAGDGFGTLHLEGQSPGVAAALEAELTPRFKALVAHIVEQEVRSRLVLSDVLLLTHKAVPARGWLPCACG